MTAAPARLTPLGAVPVGEAVAVSKVVWKRDSISFLRDVRSVTTLTVTWSGEAMGMVVGSGKVVLNRCSISVLRECRFVTVTVVASPVAVMPASFPREVAVAC